MRRANDFTPRRLTRRNISANLGATISLSCTPHTVKTCGFFVPVKAATTRFHGAYWLTPGTKAQIRLRANNRGRLNAVVAASCTTLSPVWCCWPGSNPNRSNYSE